MDLSPVSAMWRGSCCLGIGLLLAGLVSTVYAETVAHGWQERSFAGHTRYQFEASPTGFTIRGETDGAASVLYKQEAVGLVKTPILRWRWKVAQTYGSELNERSKAGDDYPARVYVVVKRGFFPWQTLALNYVWSSSAQQGDSWPNAYTDKAQMIVLQAGDAKVGEWVSEQRDVRADFKRYFDVDVDTLDGYAVMIDGDNSGQQGTAWFADIRFEAADRFQ